MPPCAGFPVYGVGQPSEAGFSGVADKVNPKDKLIWFNMRQEPVAYVGGKSVTPRKTPNPHHNIEIPGKVADMEALEVSVKQTCKQYSTIENIPYGQSSAKLPVIRSSGHQAIQSSSHTVIPLSGYRII